VPQDKRFFVLSGFELKWFLTEDDATLQRAARTAIDMRQYACSVVEGADRMLALTPASPLAKKAWYLRAGDPKVFEQWRVALSDAAADGAANTRHMLAREQHGERSVFAASGTVYSSLM